MPPAARIGDPHTCPASNGPVPHVGGPIVVGCPTVIVGGSPQARIGDLAVCVGPTDTIVVGSATVFVGGSPAARIGDATAHGGVIVGGCPTVFIGDRGPSRAASFGGAPAFATLPSVPGAGALVAVVQGHPPSLDALLDAAGDLSPLPRTLEKAVSLAIRASVAAAQGDFDGFLAQLGTDALFGGIATGLGKAAGALGKALGLDAQLIAGIVEKATWEVVNRVEIHGHTPREWSEWWMESAIDRLAHPAEHGWFDCPLPVEPPESDHPEVPTSLDGDHDVTALAGVVGLLRAYQPVVYEDPRDWRAVSLVDLLRQGTVDGRRPRTYGGLRRQLSSAPPGVKLSIDIDVDYASHPDANASPKLHARAIARAGDRIELQYSFIRPGSWLPGEPMKLFFHPGDGETVSIWVQRIPGTSTFRLERTQTGGHGAKGKVECGEAERGVQAMLSTDGRVEVFVAVGSHATAPTPGRRVFPKLPGPLNAVTPADVFAGKDHPPVPYTLITADDPDVRDTVYSGRLSWGGYGGYGAYPLHPPRGAL